MKLHHFTEINKKEMNLERIPGQTRYYYQPADFDFYDVLDDHLLANGPFKGQDLKFFDTKTGKVYRPLSIENNVLYSDLMVYFDHFIYFVQADFNKNVIVLYRYQPDNKPEVVLVQSMQDTCLYNLGLTLGDDNVYLLGEDTEAEDRLDKKEEGESIYICYYPKKFIIKEEPLEEFAFIHNNLLYFDKLIEKYDEDGNYLEDQDESQVIIKDFNNHVIKVEPGNLQELDDGNWWIFYFLKTIFFKLRHLLPFT